MFEYYGPPARRPGDESPACRHRSARLDSRVTKGGAGPLQFGAELPQLFSTLRVHSSTGNGDGKARFFMRIDRCQVSR